MSEEHLQTPHMPYLVLHGRQPENGSESGNKNILTANITPVSSNNQLEVIATLLELI